MHTAQVVNINSKVERESDAANNKRLRDFQEIIISDRKMLAEMMIRHMSKPFCSEYIPAIGEVRDGMPDAFFLIKAEMDK